MDRSEPEGMTPAQTIEHEYQQALAAARADNITGAAYDAIEARARLARDAGLAMLARGGERAAIEEDTV